MDNDITLADLRQELDDQISSSSASGFWTPAMKNQWLNRAGQRVCGFYRWPFLELSVCATTAGKKEYYPYPKGLLRFKPNSIYQISIEGEYYNANSQGRGRVSWQEFIKMKQRGDETPVFANHNGFYFLHPIPEDDKEMQLFGLKGWQTLVQEEDNPITPTEFDDSIIRLALGQALRKAKKYQEARAEIAEVMDPTSGTLAMLREDIQNEGAKGYVGQATSSRFNQPYSQ